MTQAEKFWDKQASSFDPADGNYGETHAKTVQRIKTYVHSNDRVLEVGCGTGTLSIALADSVSAIEAIDISGNMIALAEQKAQAQQITNIHFAQATVFDKRYAPASFDHILAFNLLHLLPDVPAAVDRINQLLKPGGLFVSATPCMGDKPSLTTMFLFGLSKLRLVPAINRFKLAGLKKQMHHSGFEIVETELLDAAFQEHLMVANKLSTG